MHKIAFIPQPAKCIIFPFLNSHKYWSWFLKKKIAPLWTKTSAIKQVVFSSLLFLGTDERKVAFLASAGFDTGLQRKKEYL